MASHSGELLQTEFWYERRGILLLTIAEWKHWCSCVNMSDKLDYAAYDNFSSEQIAEAKATVATLSEGNNSLWQHNLAHTPPDVDLLFVRAYCIKWRC